MDRQAEFAAFYASTAKRMVGQLTAMIGSMAEAEDVVQEAYVRAWQRWDQVSRASSPEAWIRTVAYRLSVSTWRKTVNRVSAQRRHAAGDAVPGLNPDQVALIEALRGIPPRQRSAIVLHHLVGLSVMEIAQETGLPVGTVKTHLLRGRRALAARLTDDLPDDGYGTKEVLGHA